MDEQRQRNAIEGGVNIYCVFKEGVYNQGFHGTFDSLEGAIKQADAVAAADRDDYHLYEVWSFVINDVSGIGTKHYSVVRSAALAKVAA